MNIGKIEKIGMSIMILVLVTIIFLVTSGKTIPYLLARTFFAGMIGVFIGALNTLIKKSRKGL